jgi:insertion element IS1 protein InsB
VPGRRCGRSWLRKSNHVGCGGRPLPWVEDALSGQVVGFIFGRRPHQTFRRLQALLEAAQIQALRWVTDTRWAYYDCLEQNWRVISKALLQSLERKHLTLRTRIKRLAHKTICFSKSIVVHDAVIGLFINRFFFNNQRN